MRKKIAIVLLALSSLFALIPAASADPLIGFTADLYCFHDPIYTAFGGSADQCILINIQWNNTGLIIINHI